MVWGHSTYCCCWEPWRLSTGGRETAFACRWEAFFSLCTIDGRLFGLFNNGWVVGGYSLHWKNSENGGSQWGQRGSDLRTVEECKKKKPG